MCMTFPGRVVSVTDAGALIECQDHLRRASTLLMPDVRIGEFVAVAGGTVIGRLSPEEAAELASLIGDAIGTPLPDAHRTSVATTTREDAE